MNNRRFGEQLILRMYIFRCSPETAVVFSVGVNNDLVADIFGQLNVCLVELSHNDETTKAESYDLRASGGQGASLLEMMKLTTKTWFAQSLEGTHFCQSHVDFQGW